MALVVGPQTGKANAPGKSQMTVEVDLGGVDPAVVLPQLQAALFFPSTADAGAGLPEQLADKLPFQIGGPRRAACHCTMIFEGGEWLRLDGDDRNLTPPMLI